MCSSRWRQLVAGVCLLAAAVAMLVAQLPAATSVPAQPVQEAGRPVSPDGPSRTWKRVRSQHFTALGDASERDMRRVLEEIEVFRVALLQLFPTLKVESDIPLLVVIFQNRNMLAPFQPREPDGRRRTSVSGYFIDHTDIRYMVTSASWPGQDRYHGVRVALHEYMHDIVDRNLPAIPLWLNEGLAEFYSNLAPTMTDGRRFIGRPHASAVARFRSRPKVPLDELAAITSLQGTTASRSAMFYAQSWGLVHYLMLGSPHRATQLTDYIDALNRGVSPEDAFSSILNANPGVLERELDDYLDRAQLPVRLLDIPTSTIGRPTRAEPVLESEVDALHGDLFTSLQIYDEAEAALTRSLTRAPVALPARVALGRLYLSRNEASRASAVLRSILSDDPTCIGAHFLLGEARRRLGLHDAALTSYQRVTELAPESRNGWLWASFSAIVVGRDDDAAAAASRLSRLDPSKKWLTTRAWALWPHRGREDHLVADVHEFIGLRGWRDDAAQRLALLGSLAYERTGRPDEAAALLEKLVHGAPPGSWPLAISTFLAGQTPAADLLAKAADDGQRTEAHAYIGAKASVDGDMHTARTHLAWVRDRGRRQHAEYNFALSELDWVERQEQTAATTLE